VIPRSIPFVLCLLMLAACSTQRVDLAYSPMEKPAAVAGASSVVIDLDIDGTTATTDDRFGAYYARTGYFPIRTYKAFDYVSSQSVTGIVYGAFQTELRNRGFRLGKGPVKVKITLSTFQADFRMDTVTASGDAAAGVNLVVLGPNRQSYCNRYFYGSEKVENLFVVTTFTVKGVMQKAFGEAMQMAMSDDKLFAAILKAHAEAQSALAN